MQTVETRVLREPRLPPGAGSPPGRRRPEPPDWRSSPGSPPRRRLRPKPRTGSPSQTAPGGRKGASADRGCRPGGLPARRRRPAPGLPGAPRIAARAARLRPPSSRPAAPDRVLPAFPRSARSRPAPADGSTPPSAAYFARPPASARASRLPPALRGTSSRADSSPSSVLGRLPSGTGGGRSTLHCQQPDQPQRRPGPQLQAQSRRPGPRVQLPFRRAVVRRAGAQQPLGAQVPRSTDSLHEAEQARRDSLPARSGAQQAAGQAALRCPASSRRLPPRWSRPAPGEGRPLVQPVLSQAAGCRRQGQQGQCLRLHEGRPPRRASAVPPAVPGAGQRRQAAAPACNSPRAPPPQSPAAQGCAAPGACAARTDPAARAAAPATGRAGKRPAARLPAGSRSAPRRPRSPGEKPRGSVSRRSRPRGASGPSGAPGGAAGRKPGSPGPGRRRRSRASSRQAGVRSSSRWAVLAGSSSSTV